LGRVFNRSLVTADRLCGAGHILYQACSAGSGGDIHDLLRIAMNFKPNILEHLTDDSALIEVDTSIGEGQKRQLK
jgi:hypothetical protein